MSNIHGLHSNSGNSSDDEKPTSYVGGADGRGGGSGLAVMPNPLDNEGNSGTNSNPFEAMVNTAKSDAGAAGIGKDELHAKITMWKAGFQVNDGVYRPLTDPENKPFLLDLAQGRVPRELLGESGDPNGNVNVQLEDKRDQDYVEPA